MIVKHIHQIPAFLAGDHTILREVLHPKQDQLRINYSLAQARIEAGTASLLHVLEQTEVYIFTAGEGIMEVNDEKSAVGKGSIVFVDGGAKQRVHNKGKGPLEFFCIVSPPWTATQERIL